MKYPLCQYELVGIQCLCLVPELRMLKFARQGKCRIHRKLTLSDSGLLPRSLKREMHAMWVSLKENVKCGTKVADVVGLRERCDRRCKSSEIASLDGVIAHGKETPFRELIYRSSYTQAQLFELSNGDPSRNIIEMIVRKASKNPAKPSGKIKSVLRVKNSIETLERFEKYREKVKKVAKERHMRHPRSTVDGNELMSFYCTTMACCNGQSRRVPELCNGPNCRVCMLMKSNFDTEYILEWDSVEYK